ncbi:SIMPL domain-containing protein [Erythrobacter sp. JK5]|uniref:SIMPL domain-containing protein n=1 Tax=Erythrobacter sp. JK5 TaxID=2829500 RepID=UPI001BAD552B|nr:SIMPL domain-containing protein [Erythrobacter sp. JK5]QUL39151.1 SIMPL domain-containing protein [Erythrobacter sp. JK5]
MFRHLATALAASAIAVPAHSATVEIESEGPVVELSVYESITAEPDIATISAGVTSDAATAVEAMRLNAIEMRRVIDRIKALGIDEKDIQTSGINLNARYDYNRAAQRNEFRGYQVSNRVNVKLREIEATGAVLDALVAAGATDLGGPSFSIENDEAAKAQARQRAVEKARAQAESYAAMLGYAAVRVLAIDETIRGGAPMQQVALRDAMVAEAEAAPPPVQPGMISTGVAITITYELLSRDPS